MTYKLWDAARVEKLRQCRNEGMTQLQASEALGCTENAVNRAAFLHSIKWQHPTCWTKEMEDDAKARFMAGESCSIIAKAFAKIYGVKLTRNAVIGKLHRLKIKRSAAPTIRMAYPVDRARENLTKARAAKATQPPKALKLPKPPKAANAPSAPVLIPVSANMVNLVGLTPHTCRYGMIGEGADTLFCGDPVLEGKPYCPGHSAFSYIPAKTKPKEFVRSMSRFA